MADERDVATDWWFEPTARARATVNHEDLMGGIWDHWTQVIEGAGLTPDGGEPNYPRTVCRDRHGREFWVVSSLRSRRTLAVLPDEL